MEVFHSETASQQDLAKLGVYLDALADGGATKLRSVREIDNEVLGASQSDDSLEATQMTHLLDAAKQYETSPSSNNLELVHGWRIAVAVQVARSMVQGNQVAVEDFSPVLTNISHTLIRLGDSASQSKKRLKKGLTSLWRTEKNIGDREIMNRNAEAYKLVGSNRKYGRMLTTLANL